MRPRLVEGLRWIWRGPSTVQLGVDPAHAVVLDGVDPDVVGFLSRCDGSLDVDELVTLGGQAGLPAAEIREVVTLLTGAGLVHDASAPVPAPTTARGRLGASPGVGQSTSRHRTLDPERRALALVVADQAGGRAGLARRAEACVEVHGAGRVGASIALLLAAGGVGTLRIVDDGTVGPGELAPAGADDECLNLPRPLAVRDRVERLALGTRVAVARSEDAPADGWSPDVVVVAPDGGRHPQLLRELATRRVPHLPVETRETSAVVGPLVLPGRSSCPQCLDLYRAERDPGWPAVAAQLDQADPVGIEVLLATGAGLLAAAQVLTHLDGLTPDTVDATVEISLPGLRWRRRAWSAHPACPCQRQAG
jgi:hypothetical protein